jgi:spermidine/putrescine transport system substrate-binding protein
MRQQELLSPLRHDWLPNLASLAPRYQAPSWDPRLEWSVPYMWSATGIAYHRKVTPAPRAWSDLWDERLKGRLTMLDDAEEVLGACLRKLGLSLNSTDPGELLRAQQEAIRQKHLLRAYLNAEVRDQLVAGDVLVAQVWATIAMQAIDAAPNLAFAYPAEGFPLYTDCAVILRESRRQELAHRFINYLLRPGVSAKIVEATKTATANGAAQALLPEALRNSPTLYPRPEILERAEWFATLPAATQKLRDRLWTEIKSA